MPDELPLETVEVRWFVRGAIPAAADAWFDAVAPAAEASARTDLYALPTSADAAVKRRGGAHAERKARTGVASPVSCGGVSATPEHWRKTRVAALPPGPTVEVAKRRRLAHARTSSGACTLELAAVDARGEAWWTVCLEATGKAPDARERALLEACQRWLAHPDTPALAADRAQAYPSWLRALAAEPDRPPA